MNRRTLIRRHAILGTYIDAIRAGQTAMAIATKLGLPLRRIRKDLRELEDEGVVESCAEKLIGTYQRRYWLAGIPAGIRPDDGQPSDLPTGTR